MGSIPCMSKKEPNKVVPVTQNIDIESEEEEVLENDRRNSLQLGLRRSSMMQKSQDAKNDSFKLTVRFQGADEQAPGSKLCINKKQMTSKDNSSTTFSNLYSTKEILGTGAYAEIKRCIHRRSKIARAVKIIKKKGLKSIELDRMIREINMLKGLDHPNIIRMYETFEDKNNIYIVTEYMKDGDLFAKILKQRFFSEEAVANIMRQIFHAVAYCHQLNVMHRDIKPENIMVENVRINERKSGQIVKLIDFGEARMFKHGQSITKQFGNPYCIAPEVIEGSGYNASCDIWSCGVVMYILLTSQPPFDGDADEEILKNVTIGKPDFSLGTWQNISKEAKDLVQKLLCPIPDKRIRAPQALKHTWFLKYSIPNNKNDQLRISTMKELSDYTPISNIQKAILCFIVTHLMNQQEIYQMKLVFDKLDKVQDARLQKAELIEGYQALGVDNFEEEVEKILEAADLDNNGQIDFTEFCVAAMDKRKLITNDRLKKAFDMINTKGNGKITLDEMKQLFGYQTRESDIIAMIRECDKDKDNEIMYKEFKRIMNKVLNQ